MKKNLAKRIVLGLLTGAVLMSSSVVWAENVDISSGTYSVYTFSDAGTIIGTSFGVGYSGNTGSGINPGNITSNASNSIVIGINSHVQSENSVALGNNATVNDTAKNSVALGYGSIASDPNVVSVGKGTAEGEGPATRSIINVTNVDDWSNTEAYGSYAVNVNTLNEAVGRLGNGVVNDEFTCITVDEGQTLTETVGKLADAVDGNWDKLVAKTGSLFFEQTNYLKNEENLTEAVQKLDEVVAGKADASNVYSKTDADNKFLTETKANGLYVRIGEKDSETGTTTTSLSNSFVIADTEKDNKNTTTVTINGAEGNDNPIVMSDNGITVGKNSARMDYTGFYVWADGNDVSTGTDAERHDKSKAMASMTDKGELTAAGGKFKVDADGNVTGGKYNGVDIVELANNVASNDAVAGINQRLDKTNAKINKVGAGVAALAALHPLDYDPDDKLTFSAGMGNYAGENAAALGAFYRPNEKFMLSLGGTMGNGENMVNLGISIGLDKANGFAKMSKRELIQEVNAVKAENEAIKADNEAMKAEMAEMKAMLQELLAKK